MNTPHEQVNIIIAAGATRVPVVACGPGWLVAEKPCGMSIHNDPGGDLCSLALAAVRAGRLPAVGHGFAAIHAAHRLDRDTSGLVLLAGDPKTLAGFGGQFAAQAVQKGYLALVHGRCSGPAEPPHWATWDWPLTAAAAGRNHPRGTGKHVPLQHPVASIGVQPSLFPDRMQTADRKKTPDPAACQAGRPSGGGRSSLRFGPLPGIPASAP
jgi:hypothetical protein